MGEGQTHWDRAWQAYWDRAWDEMWEKQAYSRIAPPGLQGVLFLFTWIGALDRSAQIEGMTSAEQVEARRGLAQWLYLNGVRGWGCWQWGGG